MQAMKYLVSVSAVVGIVLIYLLSSASANSALFLHSYYGLLAVAGGLALLLTLLVTPVAYSIFDDIANSNLLRRLFSRGRKPVDPESVRVSFEDVAGIEVQPDRERRVADEFHHPDRPAARLEGCPAEPLQPSLPFNWPSGSSPPKRASTSRASRGRPFFTSQRGLSGMKAIAIPSAAAGRAAAANIHRQAEREDSA